mmetsp:Transcript_32672/g.79102  ORF Transcript_32672/g.79102 Transcript_32672/m.79102 type:complete len:272 (+) Transcript_32672:634-1449(+)
MREGSRNDPRRPKANRPRGRIPLSPSAGRCRSCTLPPPGRIPHPEVRAMPDTFPIVYPCRLGASVSIPSRDIRRPIRRWHPSRDVSRSKRLPIVRRSTACAIRRAAPVVPSVRRSRPREARSTSTLPRGFASRAPPRRGTSRPGTPADPAFRRRNNPSMRGNLRPDIVSTADTPPSSTRTAYRRRSVELRIAARARRIAAPIRVTSCTASIPRGGFGWSIFRTAPLLWGGGATDRRRGRSCGGVWRRRLFLPGWKGEVARHRYRRHRGGRR